MRCRMSGRGVVAFVCWFAYLSVCGFAQSPSQSAPSLTGRVVSKTSQPVRSVWVMVYDGTSLKGRALTGDDGRFYVPRLENKRYTVVVRRDVKERNLFSAVVALPLTRSYDIKLSQ
jgi:Carboxypeptidase regulatory-like domain